MNDRNQRTIVSITPIRVEADSRTFKQATSIARFGYASIVVEGETSKLNSHAFAFELRSIGIKVSPKKLASSKNAPLSKGEKPSGAQRAGGRLGFMRTVKTYLGNVLRYLKFLRTYLRNNLIHPLKHIPKAALFYLHSPSQFPVVYLLSKIHKAPYIYDAHDFYADMRNEVDKPFVRNWLAPFYRFIESKCIKHAAAVVTVNEGIAHLQVQEFGLQPITIVRNCHDHRLDLAPAVQLRELLQLPTDCFLLVAVGRPKLGRATQEAIEAMKNLPPFVHLAFLGEGYEQGFAQITAKEQEKRVHFIPPVQPYEVVPFIRSADAALILYFGKTLNYENCLPNSFFQSIAAELPLLYPTLPQIEKLAKQYQVGLPINPQDPQSISNAALRLINNLEQYRSFKQNLKVAKEALSWEREEVILRGLISQVLQKRHHGQ